MSTWAKYLIALALALPMGAYVAGSLMASAADDPVNHNPVQIQDAPGRSGQDDQTGTPRPSKEPTRRPDRPSETATDDDSDGSEVGTSDDTRDEDDDGDVDDNGVRVVTPQPIRVDGDDDDDAGDDRDDGDDDEDKSRDRSRDRSRDGSGDD